MNQKANKSVREMQEDRVMRLHAEAFNLAGDNCPKCYGRRVIGTNVATKQPVYCSCFQKALRRASQKLREEGIYV
jgi:hypothetical protein